jgi:hypothetical protein
MLPLLHALHGVAAERGEGLRPEFLKMAEEGTQGGIIRPIQTEVAALAGDPHSCLTRGCVKWRGDRA